MIKFIILAIFFTVNSPNVRAIEEVLRGLDSIDKFNMDCSHMSNDELASECAHHVCGDPAKKSIKISASDAPQFLTDNDYKKLTQLETQLKNYYKTKQDEISSLVSEFNKRKNNANFSDLSSWKRSDWEPIIDFFWKEMTLDVNYSEPLETRKIKTINDTKRPYSEVLNEFATHFDLRKDPLRSFSNSLITTNELKTLAQQKAREYEQLLREQNKKSNFNFNQFNFLISTGVEDINALIKIYKSLIADAQLNGIEIVPNICQDHCKRSAKDLLKKLDPTSPKKDLEKSLHSLSVEDRIASCKAAFLSAHITNKKKDEFAKLWPEIKKGFEDNVFSRFSKESREKLKKYLDQEINFFYVDPHRTKFDDVSNSLKTPHFSPSQASHQEIIQKTFSMLNEDQSLYQCPTARQVHKVWDTFAPKEYIDSHPQFRPEGLIPGQDNISISPYACEHHGEGKGIIAHEMGHALSAVMSRGNISKNSSKAYLKIRKCVTNKWQNNPKAQFIYHKGDKLFSEEDTADAISYMAIQDSSALYGCTLLRPAESEYTDLATSPHLYDNHTPGIIRLLREMQYKAPQRIPSTCAEIIKRNSDKIGRTCF